ncbi:carbohydrate kinase family protein [Athalassotoga saccharophila]|uniref:carbohydrate kinase family protein n=1 Tax=Athalassotoga saccharophila TaxID=1441386 RepID=UPI001379B6FF|nr:carbohydrate kinase family protein [Athalassotoga saccharophila]BBJ28889.1 sulfofructose kinase [Athalassotoga saccharophila]
MTIAVVGDINTDYIIMVDHIPDYDGDIEIEDLKITGGGFGSNTAYALARLGDEVSLFGYAGEDVNGEIALGDLKGYVDLKGIVRCAKTGVCFSIVDKTGVRRLMTYKKDTGCDKSFDIEAIKRAKWIHLAGLDVERAKELSKKVRISSWDPGMPFLSSLDDLGPFKKIEYVLINLKEFEIFRKFPEWTLFENLIVKMGENGVRYFKYGKVFKEIPAFHVKVVDSTGAGDIFNAAFIHSMIAGYDILKAIEFASAAGAISVTKIGARNVPQKDEIEKFLEEVKR